MNRVNRDYDSENGQEVGSNDLLSLGQAHRLKRATLGETVLSPWIRLKETYYAI